MNDKSIAIIGGGFTGLVAALRLAEHGVHVTVFEAGAEVGGLAACFEACGEPLEKAYHHLFRTDDEILGLIRELGLEDRLEWLESSVAVFRDDRLWPFMGPVDLVRFGACSLVGRIRLGLVALLLKHRRDWRSLAGIPALTWMRKYCGESATRAVWEPLLAGKFASFADKVSMAWLWARLHIRANSREPRRAGERLGYLRGGFVQIAQELRSKIEALGGTVILSTRIEGIEHTDGKVDISVRGDARTYDAVVFTGSNRSLARLLTGSNHEKYLDRLGNIDYLGAVCMVFDSAQELGDYYWINVNEPGAPFLVMIRHTKLVPASRYGDRQVYYLGAYMTHDDSRFTMDDVQLRKFWFSFVRKMFPGFDDSRVGCVSVFRFRDAQHVVDCSYEEKLMTYEGPFDGLFLANFAQIYPQDRGTNFAVREGEKVANRVLGYLIKNQNLHDQEDSP